MKKLLFIFLFVIEWSVCPLALPLRLLAEGPGWGSTIVNIGIITNINVTSAIITPVTGDYEIVADGKILYRLSNPDFVHLTLRDTLIEIKTISRVLGSFTKPEFIKVGKDCSFQLKAGIPAVKTGIYDDNLEVLINNGRLNLINHIDIEKYIAGVIEAEVGKKRSVEFYKVQSIICRTYALSNARRHENDGFNLCDMVHCQVYRGKSNGKDCYNILKAVSSTGGLVIVDSNMEPITASFHSNCGGQTVNSEDLWMLPTSYLKSVKDPFCTGQNNAQWEVQIPTEKWIQYLSDKYSYPVEEGDRYAYAINYAPKEREACFNDNPEIPLKLLRSDWNLKSTYFSISTMEGSSGSLVFKGKGFGHGVGLCQEGAIKMAQVGYSYREILHFYYTDVQLLNISALAALLK